jgi:sugar lactone lactonase YvrE
MKHTGTMVIDLDTMEATYVGQFSTGSGKTLKNYWVSAPLSNTINTQVLGPKGATSTVMVIAENPGSRYTGSVVHFESAVGLNSRLTIRNKGATEIAFLPKTLSSPGFIITEDSKYDYVAQSTGTYTFNSAATLSYNNAQKTFSSVVTGLQNSYKAKKFTQWTASNLVGMPITNSGVNVITYTGSLNSGFLDGRNDTALFNYPKQLTVDGVGNVYVADFSNNRIRKITPSGSVSTLAGSGEWGFSDGVGSNAKFFRVFGIAVDSSSNVYVADENNQRIRKITPSGVVTTLAGSGTRGSADGNGVNAQFSSPTSLAVDSSGNVYVTDSGNNRIRKITPSGLVTTLAVSVGLNNSRGIAVDGNGNVYVTDSENSRICKITPEGVTSILAGSEIKGFADGTGSAAKFYNLEQLAVDRSGNIYAADSANFRIRKITPQGVVSTLAGSGAFGHTDGVGASASFSGIQGLALDGLGNIFVADSNNNLIRKITISQ